MRKSLSLMLMALLVLTGSLLAQEEDMQATANEIADNLTPVQSLIRDLKISKAIDELQFIIAELQTLTTDKLLAVLKKVIWPANWGLVGEPSTTAVGTQMFGGGTGFELKVKNHDTGDLVTMTYIGDSPLVGSLMAFTKLPFAMGGRKAMRIGPYKGMGQNKELQIPMDQDLLTLRHDDGPGKPLKVIEMLAKYFVKEESALPAVQAVFSGQ